MPPDEDLVLTIADDQSHPVYAERPPSKGSPHSAKELERTKQRLENAAERSLSFESDADRGLAAADDPLARACTNLILRVEAVIFSIELHQRHDDFTHTLLPPLRKFVSALDRLRLRVLAADLDITTHLRNDIRLTLSDSEAVCEYHEWRFGHWLPDSTTSQKVTGSLRRLWSRTTPKALATQEERIVQQIKTIDSLLDSLEL
jgi:hypothetical protein